VFDSGKQSILLHNGVLMAKMSYSICPRNEMRKSWLRAFQYKTIWPTDILADKHFTDRYLADTHFEKKLVD